MAAEFRCADGGVYQAHPELHDKCSRCDAYRFGHHVVSSDSLRLERIEAGQARIEALLRELVSR